MNWIQKRWEVWLGVSILSGALLWNSGMLRAQDEYGQDRYEWEPANSTEGFVEEDKISNSKLPRQSLTREDAAKHFALFLHRFDDFSHRGQVPEKDLLTWSRGVNSISHKSNRELVNKRNEFLKHMSEQWKQPNQTIKVQSEGEKTATVVVEIEPTPMARPLVLVEENGGWGVDLVETYAKWNNLEGGEKALAIYRLTGVELKDLPQTAEFIQLREDSRRSSCQSNLKQLSLGIMQYIQDWDEKLPPAKSWNDAIYPYVKSEQLFTCPSVAKGQKNGYAFNSKLSNKHEALIYSTAETVSIYETSLLKRNAYGMGENLAFRHQNGANYAFADGHVKWQPSTKKLSFNLNPK